MLCDQGAIARDAQSAGEMPLDRSAVLDTLNAGDPKAAIVLIRRLLDSHPDDPDLLGLLGLAMDDAQDLAGSREAYEHALAQPAETAIRLRNASNLASLLFETGQHEAAAALLKDGWHWPHERAPERNEHQCLIRLAELMQCLGLDNEVVRLLAPVATLAEQDWQTIRLLVSAMARRGNTAEALRQLESHEPGNVIAHEREALRAHLCWRESQTEHAVNAAQHYLASVPPVLMPAREGQQLIIGVIDKLPSFDRLIDPWPQAYFANNYPPQLRHQFSHRYRMAAIFCGAGDDAIERFKSWKPDVIINNVTNAETLQTGDTLAQTRDFTARLAARVINPPDKAALCTRQMNPLTLAGIDGLILPSVRRYPRDMSRIADLIAEIEHKNVYPLIVRTVYEQEARNMTLVHNRAELEDAIRALERAQFYIVGYLEQRHEHGCYRRIRAAFVDGQPIVIRADYAREWIVRSRFIMSLQTYHDHPDLLEKADAIIRTPRAELGEKAMCVLGTIGRRIPLEIFGMDFDVDDGGNVIFFEANATMGLMTPAPDPFPYPPEATQRLSEALDRLFHRFAENRA